MSTSDVSSVRVVVQLPNSSFTVLLGFRLKIVDERRYKDKKKEKRLPSVRLSPSDADAKHQAVARSQLRAVALLADNASDPRATALDYKLTHRENISVKSFCLL
jgi:hypothetical protein